MRALEPIPFFETLYRDTYPQTLLTVTRGCSDPDQIPDILQDIYADVYANILLYGAGHIRDPAAYVRAVTRRKLGAWYGLKARLQRFVPLQAADENGDEYDLPELATEISAGDAAEQRLLAAQVGQRLKSYPAEIRKIFICRFALDMPLKSIARALGLNENTVKAKLYRTLRELREHCQKEGADPHEKT